MSKPLPGTKEAQDQGCTCPVIDNHYGEGVPSKDGPLYWMSGDCPLHGIVEAPAPGSKSAGGEDE